MWLPPWFSRKQHCCVQFLEELHSHLFIFNLQCGQARLQLVVAHQELCLDRLLSAQLTHLGLRKEREFHQGGWTHRLLICRYFTKQTHPTSSVNTYLISHVWLIVKACWRTEDLAVCVHKPQLVSSNVHGIYCSLQQVQTLMAGCLQAIFCRQVCSQGACQACVVT